MILVAEDVGEHGKSFRLLDQPHRDSRDRPRQRHPGIHQCERGAAHRGHRRRPVRFGDLGNDADRVGKAVLAREQRTDGPPGELAVPDLAPPRRAHSTGFAGRIGREIVVEHEVFAILALERVDDLLVLTRPERRDDQRLRLAAGEQRRAVGARQNADLAGYRSNAAGVAAVDPAAVAQNGAAHDVLFDVLEELERDRVLRFVGKQLGQFGLRRIEPVAAVLLALRRVGGLDQRADRVAQPRADFLEFRRLRRQAPRFAGAGLGEIDDRLDHRLKLAMAKGHRAEHYVLGELLGFGFDHQHALARAGDDEIEFGARQLAQGRVQDVVAVDVAHPRAGDRPEKRDPRDRQGRRGADHRDDVGVVFQIMAQNRAHDLGFVDEPRGEERPQRPIDQPRDQRLLFGRPALALEEAPRDLAGGERLLLVVDGQRKEVLTGSCALSSRPRCIGRWSRHRWRAPRRLPDERS